MHEKISFLATFWFSFQDTMKPKSIQHTAVPNKIVLVGKIPKINKSTIIICEEHKSTKLYVFNQLSTYCLEIFLDKILLKLQKLKVFLSKELKQNHLSEVVLFIWQH